MSVHVFSVGLALQTGAASPRPNDCLLSGTRQNSDDDGTIVDI